MKRVLIGLAVWTAAAGVASAVGLKNFRELLAYYSAATGIEASNNNIRLIFKKVRGLLPEDSDVNRLTAPSVIGAVELGGAFCQLLVNKDAAIIEPTKRWAHHAVDFNLLPAQISTDTITLTAQRYAELFWDREATKTEMENLLEATTTIKNTSPATTVATRHLFTAMCATVAGSLESLVQRD